ncbi:VOC family protein [Emticicia sp. CRIBPO]|uniref:bleomycin resistance protein n=1 Tax=Emticicia sp. CRIBPO TaxID=2683258 RepID=UPI0014128FE4|nr:VOC family protein [Emticicia sp. CRIBPO]NBA88379.1 VOC family protein [Emticicia sp. CRIBPO]
MKTEVTIPILPCNSIDKILEFYQALGFAVTYQQKKPNTYAVVKLRGIELHFFVLKALQPERNYSTCYVLVHNIDELYESFVSGLRNLTGKLPVKGIPRINPLKDMPSYGVRQFIVIDPAGNYIRIGQPIEKTDDPNFRENNPDNRAANVSALAKAHDLATRLADGKGDHAAAARVLDKAMETEENFENIDLLRILILRLDMAIRLEEQDKASLLLNSTNQLIKQIDAASIAEELRLLEALKTLL